MALDGQIRSYETRLFHICSHRIAKDKIRYILFVGHVAELDVVHSKDAICNLSWTRNKSEEQKKMSHLMGELTFEECVVCGTVGSTKLNVRVLMVSIYRNHSVCCVQLLFLDSFIESRN